MVVCFYLKIHLIIPLGLIIGQKPISQKTQIVKTYQDLNKISFLGFYYYKVKLQTNAILLPSFLLYLYVGITFTLVVL